MMMAHTPHAAAPAQKVVVVDGSAEVLGLLESILDAGRYDMVFVEWSDHAYSQIRRVRPHLVILCANIDEPDAFQLLTMLKLDPETRDIPVLTYTSDSDDREPAGAASRPAEDEDDLLPSRSAPALRMN